MIMGITKALVVAKTPESFLPFFFRHLFISFRSLSAFFPLKNCFFLSRYSVATRVRSFQKRTVASFKFFSTFSFVILLISFFFLVSDFNYFFFNLPIYFLIFTDFLFLSFFLFQFVLLIFISFFFFLSQFAEIVCLWPSVCLRRS